MTSARSEAAPFWTELYHYAWCLSFGISFLVYAGLTSGATAGTRCQAVIDNRNLARVTPRALFQ
jgi:hypothetical protein